MNKAIPVDLVADVIAGLPQCMRPECSRPATKSFEVSEYFSCDGHALPAGMVDLRYANSLRKILAITHTVVSAPNPEFIDYIIKYLRGDTSERDDVVTEFKVPTPPGSYFHSYSVTTRGRKLISAVHGPTHDQHEDCDDVGFCWCRNDDPAVLNIPFLG